MDLIPVLMRHPLQNINPAIGKIVSLTQKEKIVPESSCWKARCFFVNIYFYLLGKNSSINQLHKEEHSVLWELQDSSKRKERMR